MSRGLRRRLASLLLAATAIAALPVAAEPAPHRLTVVLSADEPAYHAAWQGFRDKLLDLAGPALPFDIKLVTLQDGALPHDDHGTVTSPDLVIPVGAQAALHALEHYPGTPVYSILITRDAFETIRHGRQGDSASALFLDQPFDRQFRLMRLVLPAVRDVSVVLGREARLHGAELTTAARRSEIRLHVIDFEAMRTPVDAFSLALERGDAVFVLPDPEVLSPNHAKWLLYMAYQQRIPVIGFSRALTDAGALAALHTTPAQVGLQAAEQVISLALAARERPGQPWRLPPPVYPRYFEVSVNHAVARALEYEPRDQRQLARSLWSIEQLDRMQADQGRYDPERARP